MDGNRAKTTPEPYADYPLIVVNEGTKKEIVHFIADANGKYRIALPPGNYVLDLQDRARKHIRAKPQPFTIISNRTAHVDIHMDTGPQN